MASGATLLFWLPGSAEPPATNYATFNTVNSRTVLEFDQTTQEAAMFAGVMPRSYASGGITVAVHWMTSAITGTGGWDVAIERISDGATDLDADSFATAKVVTAAAVPGTAGVAAVGAVAFANGSEMDGVSAGDLFRLRVRRDVANDTAAADLRLLAIEVRET